MYYPNPNPNMSQGTNRNTNDLIISWWDHYEFLRPTAGGPVFLEGTLYENVLKAWVGAHFKNPLLRLQVKSYSDYEVAQWVKTIDEEDLVEGWDENMSRGVLINLLLQKFGLMRAAPAYRDKIHNGYQLMKTRDAQLVYENFDHNQFMGQCTCLKCSPRANQNMLGLLLMEIRERLRPSWEFPHELILTEDCDLCWWAQQYSSPADDYHLMLLGGGRNGPQRFGILRFCEDHQNDAYDRCKSMAIDGRLWTYNFKAIEKITSNTDHVPQPVSQFSRRSNVRPNPPPVHSQWHSRFGGHLTNKRWGDITLQAGKKEFTVFGDAPPDSSSGPDDTVDYYGC